MRFWPNRWHGLAVIALGAAVLPSCSSADCSSVEYCGSDIVIRGHVGEMPTTLLVRVCVNGACGEATGPWPNVNPHGGADLCLQSLDSQPGFSFCPQYDGPPTGFLLSVWRNAEPRDGDQLVFDLTTTVSHRTLIHLERALTYTHTTVPDGVNCDQHCTNASIDADHP